MVGEEVDAVEDLVVAVAEEASEAEEEEEVDVASEVGPSYQHMTSVCYWSLHLICVLFPFRWEMM